MKSEDWIRNFLSRVEYVLENDPELKAMAEMEPYRLYNFQVSLNAIRAKIRGFELTKIIYKGY